ncbi:MAG: hypothetical protein WA252_21420 [Candidatus Sulfotelmatobacter sp.]
MNRINLFRTNAIRHSAPALDLSVRCENNLENRSSDPLEKKADILVFAGVLIVCSLAVGCSSEKPKPQVSSNQTSSPQSMPPAPTTPVPATPEVQAAAKPVHKKVVHRAPATVNYVDKDSSVSFRYPRKYVLKTGDAADELVSSNLTVMDFSQPGGVVTAAVEIPEGTYPKSDLVSAMFDVSVNKSLTAEQCGEFSAPPSGSATPAPSGTAEAPMPKLLLGGMELTSAETMGNAESRKEESKYYHVFENGACYEFALKVATSGVEPDEGGKPVDRDEVFKKLETILATVKINPIKIDATKINPLETEKQTASAPAVTPTTPAQ